ncbi:MAG: PDZ domain-containing protein [Bacteroidales bacterium]|nr:PDZ domain-containing protein [Bacteroidales bacterium]MCF8454377.1 PDZ domain-containing protein [Bacteroidales bacterium]
MNKTKILFLIAIFAFAFQSNGQEAVPRQAAEARLLRFPAISGDQVVFTYAGDLYTVSTNGGEARKLTSHDGFEIFAKYSPDGKSIAFTGQYDGNTEVFLIPSEGGEPKRLTVTAALGRDDISDRMGPNNIVMAWTPDGKDILYRSRKQTFNSFTGQLFKVPSKGGMSEELPLPTGGFCSYNGDGTKLAYNRVFREFRTWKYYKGGMADDVWIYDFNTKQTTNITNNDNQNIFPMWYKNEIYFLSDRDRIMNLFMYDLNTKQTRKVTNFTEYDVKFPSIGKDKIIFENAGYLYVFDISTQKQTKLTVSIKNDFLNSRKTLVDASKNIRDIDLSPNGERLVFAARGDIFTVPAKEGITRNLTQSSGVHDREVSWSPDGKFIAFLSDKNGEYEIYMQKQDGSEEAVQLTKNADTYKYSVKWSPDSKKILFSDKKLRLSYVDVDSKKTTEVFKSEIWEIRDYDWSPDSKWITFTKPAENQMTRVCLYELASKKITEVTDYWYSSGSPSFSSDGKYLFFTSERDFNPIYSATEWNHAYRDMSKIYFATLAKDTPSPFAPENDEVEFNKEDEKKDKEKDKDEKKEEKKSEDIKVDIDGIGQRIVALPLGASNYFGVNAISNKVYYIEYSSAKRSTALTMFDMEKKKETVLGDKMSYGISSNHKKMLVISNKNYYIIDLPTSKISLDKAVDVSNMKMWVNKDEEWNQIYHEAWRQMRDFFYDPNMHGVDWPKMEDKYAALLPYVNHRADLNYLIGELIGELSIGHAYINGGDRPQPERIKTGLLGAKISKHSSGYFKIDEILKGANWNSELRSPLTEMGVDAAEGDFIISINGQSTKDLPDLYAALVDFAGKQVEMEISEKADGSSAKKCLVVPIADESALYYYNWVQGNVEKVNKATNGQVGYIHIPDMGAEGLNEFVKYFYPQLDKKALIIDDRGNGGGNVSPMIIERLRREITRANMSRNVTVPGQTPRQMMVGPKVLLVNNYSASDGDLFPYSFKKHGLGKVIGVRTWGGVVGIRGSLPFVDGADLRKPEFASYSSEDSSWIIEGWGVEPDIWVDNDPAKEYAGEDQQLNKAIEVILEELKTYDKQVPPVPDKFPVKNK